MEEIYSFCGSLYAKSAYIVGNVRAALASQFRDACRKYLFRNRGMDTYSVIRAHCQPVILCCLLHKLLQVSDNSASNTL